MTTFIALLPAFSQMRQPSDLLLELMEIGIQICKLANPSHRPRHHEPELWRTLNPKQGFGQKGDKFEDSAFVLMAGFRISSLPWVFQLLWLSDVCEMIQNRHPKSSSNRLLPKAGTVEDRGGERRRFMLRRVNYAFWVKLPSAFS